jgi:hypothetical protein
VNAHDPALQVLATNVGDARAKALLLPGNDYVPYVDAAMALLDYVADNYERKAPK